MSCSDRDEIRRLFEEVYAENITTEDRIGYGNMYTEDALWMPPNAPNRCGREDIMNAFDRMVRDKDIIPSFVADEIQILGEIGYVIGVSDATIFFDEGGSSKQAIFQALWIVKKVDKIWKIDRQIWNNKPI